MFTKLKTLSCLLLLLCCCSRQQTQDSRWREENGKVKVLTSIAMINDLVKQIGGDDVDSISLIKGGLDPHSYDMVKGDDEKFARADLVFFNGLGLEHGLSLRRNLLNNPRAIAVADSLLEYDGLILMVDEEYDPHVWMDISLWMYAIDPIVEALSKKDPEHAAAFKERGEALRLKMSEADKKIFNALQALPADKRFLVTSHDAFHYFARHYLAAPGEKNWHMRCQAPEGLAPEAQMSVNDVIAIVAHIEKCQISVLFPESNVSQDSLQKILSVAKEKGLTIRICVDDLYGDSMGNASSYLDMVNHNAEIIARELKL